MTEPQEPPEVEHVVVLMFENRSFDHMLGLLRPGDDRYGGVVVGDLRFSNPRQPFLRRRGRVPVSDGGAVSMPFDTPHSHGAVMHQMRPPLGAGPLTMDGFIDSYRKKITAPKTSHPEVRLLNIVLAVLVSLHVLAAVLALPLVLPHVLGALAVLAAVATAIYEVRRRDEIWPVHLWGRVFFGVVAVACWLVLASTVLAAIDPWWARFGANLALVVATCVALAAAWWLRRRKLAVTPDSAGQAERIMACMTRDEAPALWRLAESFAVCTRWHCSVPGATWPNRNFAHAGTSDGTVDIEVGLYEDDTVFDRLTEAGRSWHIYRDRDGLAQAMVFGRLLDDDNLRFWHPFENFAAHVADEAAGKGTLPAYSFIEPCHDGPRSNSQHPGNNDHDRSPDGDGLTDFERGEQLLINVYETLRTHPEVFAKTVLVVTYDEHGGFYDHEPPPTNAVPPGRSLDEQGRVPRSRLPRWLRAFVRQPDTPFDFRTLGPRVPAVVISPRIPAGPDRTLYDHSAIPATVRKLFASGTTPLSDREARSPTFDRLVQIWPPREDLPILEDLVVARAGFGGFADAGDGDVGGPITDLTQELERVAPEIGRRVQRAAGGVRPAPAAEVGFGPFADGAGVGAGATPPPESPLAVARLLTAVGEQKRAI